MAAEQLLKLDPSRTFHLRGFDRRGAAAALYAATPTSCKLSGVFRAADMEAALGANFAPDAIDGATVDASAMLSDIHGDAAYRANLVKVMANAPWPRLGELKQECRPDQKAGIRVIGRRSGDSPNSLSSPVWGH